MNAFKKFLARKFQKKQNRKEEEELNAELAAKENVVRQSLRHKTSNRNLNQSIEDSFAIEIFALIFSFLEPFDLCVCEQVNKYWMSLASQESLWKRLCFQAGIESVFKDNTWKQQYWETFRGRRKYEWMYRNYMKLSTKEKIKKGLPIRFSEFQAASTKQSSKAPRILGFSLEPNTIVFEGKKQKIAFNNSTNKTVIVQFLGEKRTVDGGSRTVFNYEGPCAPYSLVRETAVVSDSKRTIGELDLFIYRKDYRRSLIGADIRLIEKIRDLSPTTFLGTFMSQKVVVYLSYFVVDEYAIHRSPNFAKLIGASNDEDAIRYYMTEYYEGENLYNIIDSLSLYERLVVLWAIFEASKNPPPQTYRMAITPSNVIVERRETLNVRFALKLHTPHQLSKQNAPFYPPLHVINTSLGVLYSFGSVAYFLFSGMIPYSFGKTERFSTNEILDEINGSHFPEFPSDVPEEISYFITQMWKCGDLQQLPRVHVRVTATYFQLFINKKLIMSRDEAESLLNDSKLPGPFLIRWSKNNSTFALSAKSTKFFHFGFSLEEDGRLNVLWDDGKKLFTLMEFAEVVIGRIGNAAPLEKLLDIDKELLLKE